MMKPCQTAAALSAVALVLGACHNTIESHAPIFTPRDAVGAPVVKPGIWGLADACPASTRPEDLITVECALGHYAVSVSSTHLLIRDNTPPIPDSPMPWDNPENPWATPVEYLVIPGDPAVLQLHVVSAWGKHSYLFAPARPVEIDANGAVVAIETWLPLCGPPPKEGDWNYGIFGEKGGVTNDPYPGLTMHNYDCDAEAPAGVWESVRRSGTRPEDRLRLKWLGPAA